MSYRFFLFLVDAFRKGDTIFVAGYPHQHPEIHQYNTNNPTDMDKKKEKTPLDDYGISTLDPDAIMTAVEREGELYPISRKELMGHEIRMEVRSIVRSADPKGFDCYKKMKSEASDRVSRLEAYAFLLYRFFTRTAREYDTGFQLRLSIVDLAILNTGFDRAHLGGLGEKDAVRYIIDYFLLETYITTHL